VPNLPNLGVVPIVSVNGSEFSALATQLSTQYNIALSDMLLEWEGVVNIIPFDTFTFISKVVSEPASFGFLNSTEACYTGFVAPAGPDDTVCDDPDSYVFYDREHPTEAFYTLLANRMLLVASNDVLDDLIARFDLVDANPAFKHSLGAILHAVKRRINRPKNNHHNTLPRLFLSVFLHVVEAQADRIIAVEDSVILIERGEKVLAILGGEL
jgi:phospholipase/lecithinase/hemolysin